MKRITEESLSKLSKTKLPLVIYGAGGVSNVCMERLLYLGIEVECVAVTNIKTNPSVVFGKRVYSVDDVLKKYQNFLVVVCVLEDKQKEIYNLLALKGIDVSNIFFMTDELYFGWQKENVEVALNNKDVSYYKRYTEPYIKTLNRICQEREYSIDEARRFIDKGLDILEDNEVCMARLVIVLSTKCSLKCVECNNLIPHFQPQRDLDANVILRSIEMITQSVGKILKCELIGGEPFMSKNLEVVLREILSNEKIEAIEITTNGTIIPKDTLLELIRHPKVLVRISDYGVLVNKKKLIQWLEKNKVAYEVLKTEKWISPGGVEKREKDILTLKKEYASCASGYVCKTLFENRIFACARAASLNELGYMNEPESIYVNENYKAQNLKKFLLREFSIACNYCDMASVNKIEVEPAVQMKGEEK